MCWGWGFRGVLVVYFYRGWFGGYWVLSVLFVFIVESSVGFELVVVVVICFV